jgi:hypothetical protein
MLAAYASYEMVSFWLSFWYKNVVESSNGWARMTWNPKFECIYFIGVVYRLVVVLVSKGKWN